MSPAPSPTIRARSLEKSKMIPLHAVPLSADEHGIATLGSKPNITDFTVSIPGSTAQARAASTNDTSPRRWYTTEFKIYAVVFAFVVPIMVWLPINLSSPKHPNYGLYSHRLSPGWLFGWQVDNSDAQYRSFRSNLFPLLLLASAYLLFSKIFSRLTTSTSSRARFILAFSTFMIILLHGISAFKIIVILSLNYYAAKLPSNPTVKRLWPGVVVCGNMGILFFNEKYDGYKLGNLHAVFAELDALNGLLPRWHISFNITMLRMVSFSLDYLWRDLDPAKESQPPVEYRKRVSTPLPADEYSYINYLAYCLYPPLYIAGPIMTFNDFVWQLRTPLTIPRKAQISYAVRFMFCLLSMESVLHTMYVVAIKDSAAWAGDSPAELSMIGFWNLVVVWLKLLIPWRFFRLWALLDGVDAPENMVRCIANNYSTLGFWRSWHRSYNLWIVRYIYIPVGGAHNVVLSTTLVFTFVALWHDLSFKLLAWGWLVSLFIVPELVARKTFSANQYGSKWWYRHLCAAGGVVNVLLMMTANLVGFVLGLDGTKYLITQLTSTLSGWAFMVFASWCLFVAVQVMFEYREEEKRKGIDRRC